MRSCSVPRTWGQGAGSRTEGYVLVTFAPHKPYWNERLLAAAGILIVGYQLHTHE